MKNLFKIILSYLLISFNTYVFSIENNNSNLLKIGVLAPFSGEFKELGETVLYSVNLALHDINDKSIRIYPKDSKSLNLAFDITPSKYITSLITEKGICEASNDGLKKLFPDEKLS